MRTHALVLSLALLPAWSLRTWAGAEPEKAAPTVEERILALEKRIQALEQAMVEKDARIADLQRRLNEPAANPQAPRELPLPGMQFRLNPGDMERFQQQLEEYMRRGFDAPGGPFGGGDEEDVVPFRGRRGGGDINPAQKPRLGVTLQDANAELAELYKNKAERGAYVTQVLPDTAAEKAGLMTGDCVVSFDNKPIDGAQDLIDTVKVAPEGRHQLVVKRRGEDLGLNVTFGPLIAERPRAENGWIRNRGKGPREVLEIRATALELTQPLADALGLDAKQRAKMETVLSVHAKQLQAEYAEKAAAGGPGRLNLQDRALQPLVDKHAAEAEAELRETLSDAQMKTWREYRARHRGISISRNIQAEPEEGKANEGMNF
jgi:hypothetical protein